ncbi:MAG: hypothetical protein QM571_04240 [Micrococcaceae bacterium]
MMIINNDLPGGVPDPGQVFTHDEVVNVVDKSTNQPVDSGQVVLITYGDAYFNINGTKTNNATVTLTNGSFSFGTTSSGIPLYTNAASDFINNGHFGINASFVGHADVVTGEGDNGPDAYGVTEQHAVEPTKVQWSDHTKQDAANWNGGENGDLKRGTILKDLWVEVNNGLAKPTTGDVIIGLEGDDSDKYFDVSFDGGNSYPNSIPGSHTHVKHYYRVPVSELVEQDSKHILNVRFRVKDTVQWIELDSNYNYKLLPKVNAFVIPSSSNGDADIGRIDATNGNVSSQPYSLEYGYTKIATCSWSDQSKNEAIKWKNGDFGDFSAGKVINLKLEVISADVDDTVKPFYSQIIVGFPLWGDDIIELGKGGNLIPATDAPQGGNDNFFKRCVRWTDNDLDKEGDKWVLNFQFTLKKNPANKYDNGPAILAQIQPSSAKNNWLDSAYYLTGCCSTNGNSSGVLEYPEIKY